MLKAIRSFCPNPQAGAEIGVFKAETVGHIHREFPKCRMVLVDPWGSKGPYSGGGKMSSRTTPEEWLKIEKQAQMNIFASRGPSLVLKMTSEEAAKQIEVLSLDFVFLDGNHAEVDKDLELWEPKCKKLMMGHDFGSKLDKKGFWNVEKSVRARYPDRKIHVYKGYVWAVEL